MKEVLREFVSLLLQEGRWEDLWTRIQASPFLDKEDEGKHQDWIRLYSQKGVPPKFADLVWKTYKASRGGGLLPPDEFQRRVVDPYNKLVSLKPPGWDPDLSKYKDVHDLIGSMGRFKDYTSKSKEKTTNKVEGTKVEYQDKDWLLNRITTKEASCRYGKETKWCISATESENYFNQYYGQGFTDFWFLIHKPTGIKYAISLNSVQSQEPQIWNSNDKLIETDAIRDFLQEFQAPPDLIKKVEAILETTLSSRVLSDPERFLAAPAMASAASSFSSSDLKEIMEAILSDPERFQEGFIFRVAGLYRTPEAEDLYKDPDMADVFIRFLELYGSHIQGGKKQAEILLPVLRRKKYAAEFHNALVDPARDVRDLVKERLTPPDGEPLSINHFSNISSADMANLLPKLAMRAGTWDNLTPQEQEVFNQILDNDALDPSYVESENTSGLLLLIDRERFGEVANKMRSEITTIAPPGWRQLLLGVVSPQEVQNIAHGRDTSTHLLTGRAKQMEPWLTKNDMDPFRAFIDWSWSKRY